MAGRCLDRDTSIFLDGLKIVVAYVARVVVGDSNKGIEKLLVPGVNDPVDTDPKRLELVLAVATPEVIGSLGPKESTLEFVMKTSLHTLWI